MTREGDGTWCVNPDSLESPEHTAGGAYADPLPGSAEETPETTGNTVLYFCPEGGEYYHTDQIPTLAELTYGLFSYEFEVDASFENTVRMRAGTAWKR